MTTAETAVSSSPSAVAADELEKRGSFDEMEFLKFFDGDEETIGRHFITVRIWRIGVLDRVQEAVSRILHREETTGKGTKS